MRESTKSIIRDYGSVISSGITTTVLILTFSVIFLLGWKEVGFPTTPIQITWFIFVLIASFRIGMLGIQK